LDNYNKSASQQVIVGNNQMTKIALQAAVPDHRDFHNGKFQLVLSADGHTIYARSPIKDHYLLHESKHNFVDQANKSTKCNETLLSHKTNSTRLFDMDHCILFSFST
jgi:hypothetical protein